MRIELQDFAHAIRTGEEPRSNVALGLAIIAAVEMAEASMRHNGVRLALAPVAPARRGARVQSGVDRPDARRTTARCRA